MKVQMNSNLISRIDQISKDHSLSRNEIIKVLLSSKTDHKNTINLNISLSKDLLLSAELFARSISMDVGELFEIILRYKLRKNPIKKEKEENKELSDLYLNFDIVDYLTND